MQPKHVLTLASLVVIVLIGLATVAGAQTPQPTTISSPAVYDPELRAANLTTIDVPAVWPGELRVQALSVEDTVIAGINVERQRKGLLPVVRNSYLTKAAQDYAQFLADCGCPFGHNSDGGSPWQRIPAAGYTGSLGGEILAGGQPNAAEAVQAWTLSPGHYAIETGAYGEIGCGFVDKPGAPFRFYWVCDFGGTPGQTTPGSNPGPVLTNTPVSFLKTPTPYNPQPTPTVPWWLFTPTPYIQPTPLPQPQGNGWRVTLDCNSYGLCTGIISAK